MADNNGGVQHFGGVTVDTSKAMETLQQAKEALSQKGFEAMMGRVVRRTAGTVRRILREDVPKKYHASPSWAAKSVGSPKIDGMNAVIPLRDLRGLMPSQFHVSASGDDGRQVRSATRTTGRGANKKVSRRAYKLLAKVVKDGESVLPTQGDRAFFKVFKGAKRGMIFVRHPDRKLSRAVGIGVPQMPMNRSAEEVEADLQETFQKNLEHEIEVRLGGIGGQA